MARWTDGRTCTELVYLSLKMKPKEPRGGPLEMRLAPLKSLLAASLLFVCGCKVTQPGVLEKEMAKEVKHKITVGGKDDTPMAS